jgi:hypothetical protein
MKGKRLCVSGITIVIIVLVLGMTWQFTPGLFPSRAAPAVTVVSLSGERIEQSSAAAADFDGDGDKEIVIGGKDGMLYVLAYSGSTWSVVWSRQTADDLNAAGAPATCATTNISDIRSAPAVGDLDQDGHLEIVVTTGGDPGRSADGLAHRNGGVLVYRYDSAWSFSAVPGWPQPKLDIVGLGAGASDPDGCWDGIWGSPALGDLDGDGDLEIAVEGFDRALHVWHHDGSYPPGWPIDSDSPPREPDPELDVSRGGWSTPAIADIDKDGLPEVIFGTDYRVGGLYNLYVFNYDISVLAGFPVQATSNMMSAPAIGDINNDGWLDIVVGTGTYEATGGSKVYAWDHTGNLLSGWPTITGGNMPASPALGDLDGDGDLEIVIGCGGEGDSYNPAPCTSLYAWHGDGSSVGGFPMSPANNTGWPADPNGLPIAPVLADYDGDGSVEILVVNRWSWGISTVENNGASNNDANLVTQTSLSGPPIVDDVDNDGTLEVVIGGGNSGGTNGAIYIWDRASPASSKQPWPMFHHNVARTGLYSLPPEPPKLAFPSQVRVLHQSGSGNTATRHVWLANEGDGEFDWSITESIPELQVIPSAGTVVTSTSVRFDVGTTGLGSGWHTLGTMTVSGTAEGEAVDGSPATSTVYVYVGDIAWIYLPLTGRNY